MSPPIVINNIRPHEIHWPNVDSIHIFHPVYGQLEAILRCSVCGNVVAEWACLKASSAISFNLLRSNGGYSEWTLEEFLTLAMEVIRLTDESERRFISFHVMPKVDGDPTGFQAIPYMVPPLLDQEVRLYRYYEQVLGDQHKHQQMHKLIEEKPHGRIN